MSAGEIVRFALVWCVLIPSGTFALGYIVGWKLSMAKMRVLIDDLHHRRYKNAVSGSDRVHEHECKIDKQFIRDVEVLVE